VEHHMPHAERTGAEARDGPARLERSASLLRTVEDFEAIARRISEADARRHAAQREVRHRHLLDAELGGIDAGGDGVVCLGIRHLPAEDGGGVCAAGHDEALLAIVHAELEHCGAALHQLKAEKARSVRGPVVEPVRMDTDISERVEGHACCSPVWPARARMAPMRGAKVPAFGRIGRFAAVTFRVKLAATLVAWAIA